MKVLIVCHGNICRSPMGEMMLKYKLKQKGYDWIVDSAAGSSEEVGNPIYPPAKATLKRHCIPFTEHYARKMTKADYDDYDEILVMDRENLWLLNRIVKDEKNKIRLLLSFTERGGEVADPWYTGDFEETYRDLDEGLDAFIEYAEKNYGIRI
ncbi:MAG: low molecular weight phosphotyrosine protein phosphatase [Clostridia bacterium]|nr:low molecular weight phosphotyrosine protein phosphatase [Clostridia bacterium]